MFLQPTKRNATVVKVNVKATDKGVITTKDSISHLKDTDFA